MIIELSDEVEEKLKHMQNHVRETWGLSKKYPEIIEASLLIADIVGDMTNETVKGLEEVKGYLEKKGLNAVEYSDIILASLKIAERMGAGKYGIYCELREDGK